MGVLGLGLGTPPLLCHKVAVGGRELVTQEWGGPTPPALTTVRMGCRCGKRRLGVLGLGWGPPPPLYHKSAAAGRSLVIQGRGGTPTPTALTTVRMACRCEKGRLLGVLGMGCPPPPL